MLIAQLLMEYLLHYAQTKESDKGESLFKILDSQNHQAVYSYQRHSASLSEVAVLVDI